MPFGQTAGQVIDRGIIVEVIGRKFQIELFLQLHHQVDDHRRIKPEPVEDGVGLDGFPWNPEHISQGINTELRDLLSSHADQPDHPQSSMTRIRTLC
jgi:hypothetical protein